MNYRVFYYDADNPTQLLAVWKTNFLPKTSNYVTVLGVRYVVTDVVPPKLVQEFQPHHVIVLCKEEKECLR